ncbi:hypothetical protein [Dactylosporangium sp. NPDC049140]|uniref:WD40 repeat domain-containing protein n=1 Tax=Dactylosporangium sp. NPDC049140 TaxID=3155647 RepID=UPI0033CFC053
MRRPDDPRLAFAAVAAVAPDGTWLVLGTYDAVLIRDRGAGAVEHRRTPAVWSVAVAPDGSWYATGHRDGPVLLWRGGSARPLGALAGHDGPVAGIAVDDTGTWIATAGEDRMLRVWARDGRCVAAMRVELRLTACAWVPPGATLAAAGPGGTYLFDLLPAERSVQDPTAAGA